MVLRTFACFLLVFLASFALAEETYEWEGVQRIVAIGDLHGDYEQYLAVLTYNGLINHRRRWTGGETHLVQLGDITDRGPDSLKIIEHLGKLTQEARRAGGAVHALIGNHEAMNIEGDLRYVHKGEYEAFQTRRSSALQLDYVRRVFDYMVSQQPELEDSKEATIDQLKEQYPLGYVEHRTRWQAGRDLAEWVADNNAVIKINRTLFAHGGINPHQELKPLADINQEIQRVLSTETNFAPTLANDENGPLWYRGLASNDPEIELEPVRAMLDHYGADRIVIAHTPTGGEIVPRLDGMVIMADTGISAHYGGHLANLVIEESGEGTKLYARKPEQMLPLEVE